MANYWMHNGFLQVEGEKMAKSAGNFVTIREFFQNWQGHPWPGEALRFNMLRTQYRQPIDWTLAGLDESHKILWEWSNKTDAVSADSLVPTTIVDALADDINTPAVISELHRLYRSSEYSALRAALNFLGFSGTRASLARHYVLHAEPGQYDVRGAAADLHVRKIDSIEVQKRIDARNAARKSKNFAESDRIRDELAAMGVVLKDTKDGTTWAIAR
jgi:cysteinyl-tRNA synthetase